MITVRVLIEMTWHDLPDVPVTTAEAGHVILVGKENLPEVKQLLEEIADEWGEDL